MNSTSFIFFTLLLAEHWLSNMWGITQAFSWISLYLHKGFHPEALAEIFKTACVLVAKQWAKHKREARGNKCNKLYRESSKSNSLLFFFLLYFRTESMCASKENIFLEKKEKNAGTILRHTQNKIFRKYNIVFPRAAIVGRERDFRVVVDVLKPDRFSFFFDCALSLARQRPRGT